MANPIDKDLVAALRQAKGGRPMRFAYVANGTEGKLLVAKKVSTKETAQAKKDLGGGYIYLGRCVGEDGTLFFEVVKLPPASLVFQIKKRLKEDAGLTWPIEIRTKADAEAAAEEEGGEDAAVPVAPPLSTGDASQADATKPSTAPPDKGLDEREPSAKAAPQPVSFVRLQQCRLVWAAAVKKVEADIIKLKIEADDAYEDEPALQIQINKGLERFIAELQSHYESLSDKLDEALNAGTAAARAPLHEQACKMLKGFQAHVESDPLLAEIDDNGLVPVQIRKILVNVLSVLADKLGT